MYYKFYYDHRIEYDILRLTKTELLILKSLDQEIWVNIGSGNGLLLDGTKLLPEPILTYHQ